jgi:hypothetical protein
MVIGIQDPGKRTAGGSRGVSAPSARPFRPYSNRLLRRRRGFLRGLGSSVSGVGRGGSGISARIGSGSTRISGGTGSGVSAGSSGIGRRVGSGLGSSSGIGSGIGRVVSSFLFGATGTQHEGNRNGAPDLCIHRQLPQYVSEN